MKIENFWSGPDGVRGANICYGLISAAMTESILTACANIIQANTEAHVVPLISDGWTYIEATVSANDGSELTATTPANVPGGVSDAFPLSPQVCVVIGWEILARYRGGHPRWYQPGAPVNVVDNSGGRLLLGSALTAWQTAWAAFLEDVNTSDLPGGGALSLGTIAYFRHNAPLVPPVFYPYQSADVRPRLGTQRRRLGKPPLA